MNVVSYAFFRHDASAYESERCGASRGNFFVNYLPAVVRAHHSVYPEWELRIHHDQRVRALPYFAVLERMECQGLVRLVDMGNAGELCRAMLWRMAPAWDSDVEYFLCRDVDSLSTPRERICVEEWIAGGKPIHSIHDSPSHMGCLILGGLCGFEKKFIYDRIHDLSVFLGELGKFKVSLSKLGDDQRALKWWFGKYESKIHHYYGPYTGPHPDPRDQCGGHARCMGGAYHCGPVADWYDKHYPNPAILKCEEATNG